MKPHIAILLPCYNEALTIAKTVADFRTALPDATVYVLTMPARMIPPRLP